MNLCPASFSFSGSSTFSGFRSGVILQISFWEELNTGKDLEESRQAPIQR